MFDRLAQAVRRSPDRWALLTIAAAVVLANVPYLLGIFDPNPLGPRSALLASTTPGRLAGLPTIDPSNGFISQALGHRAMLDWVHLQAPWWNPYDGTGTPLIGEMESAALFPFTILTLFSNGQLYEHVLLEILSGWSTYLLLRRISVGRPASLAGGIAFALNGTFAWFTHGPVNPIAFLPLLLLGIEIAYGAAVAGRKGGWWLIPIAGALSLYAGFPEVAYIDTLLAACWIAWRAGCLERKRLRAFAGKMVGGMAAGTLLSAPLLIPFLDYLSHADTGAHASGGYSSVHLASQALPPLLLPYVYGPIFSFDDPQQIVSGFWGAVGGYLSISLVLFAVIGLLSRRHRGLRTVLGVWIVLVIARVYGVPPVLGHVLGVIPGMSSVAFFRYAWPALELPVIILAAIGLSDVIDSPLRGRRLIAAAALVGGAVLAAVLAARPVAHSLGHTFSEHPFFDDAVIWGAGVLVVGLAAAVVREPRLRRLAIVSLVVLDAAVLFVVPELSAPRRIGLDLKPVQYLRSHLGNGRFFTLGPFGPNYGSYFGVSELNINDVPVPSGFKDYVHAHLDPFANALVFVGYRNTPQPNAPSPAEELIRNLTGYRLAAVNYVLTPPGQSLPQSRSTFQLVDQTPSTWIYHLSGAAPYFTATNRSCAIADQTKESLRLTCPTTSTLIKRELELPGWSAAIDGHGAAVHQTATGFQEINVGAGVHRISFSYTPPNIPLALLAFAAGVVWLVGPPALRRRRQTLPCPP
jgi:Bacterial membrane protein YfhO